MPLLLKADDREKARLLKMSCLSHKTWTCLCYGTQCVFACKVTHVALQNTQNVEKLIHKLLIIEMEESFQS